MWDLASQPLGASPDASDTYDAFAIKDLVISGQEISVAWQHPEQPHDGVGCCRKGMLATEQSILDTTLAGSGSFILSVTKCRLAFKV